MRITEKKMKRFVVVLAIMVSVAVLLTAGNTSAANWPEKGRQITVYLTGGPGGGADIPARTVGPSLEQELGIKFVFLNRPPNQICVTEFMAKAGNDGYTILHLVIPSMQGPYLDPARKAPYSGKDFQLVTSYAAVPAIIAVAKNSRFKSLKDLVDAARANPGKIKVTASGPMTSGDLGIISLEKAAGVKFAHMFFDQQGEQRAALLGGHVDAESNIGFELVPGQKSGEIETVAVLDTKRYIYLPDLKTAEEQGYKAYGGKTTFGYAYKTGIPKEIIDVMAAAVKTAAIKPDFKERLGKIGLAPDAVTGKEFAAIWKSAEDAVGEVIKERSKK